MKVIFDFTKKGCPSPLAIPEGRPKFIDAHITYLRKRSEFLNRIKEISNAIKEEMGIVEIFCDTCIDVVSTHKLFLSGKLTLKKLFEWSKRRTEDG